jgi:hypothetical protein
MVTGHPKQRDDAEETTQMMINMVVVGGIDFKTYAGAPSFVAAETGFIIARL